MNIDIPILENRRQENQQPEQSLNRKVYVETYGCQMNMSDSEIVSGVMHKHGYEITETPDNADVILLNTCAVRDNAEKKIHSRLQHLRYYKKRNKDLVVGLLGCMAERLRGDLIGERDLVDIVVGPDEYRRVPELVENALSGTQGIAVRLSRVETYDDIIPLRTEGICSWLSIMRGCDKFCTFCVVPFTRGRERSRAMKSVLDELQQLQDAGFKEVTLLGQNVNSYHDDVSNTDFADLLRASARAVPGMRIRYTTSHPFDMSDKLIDTMAEHENICKHIHLPVQSGSDRILTLMNRNYSVKHYVDRIQRIREIMPHCALSTDIIVGFCTETEDDHRQTLELMREVRYEGAYMFNYSARENTKAWKMTDDVSQEIKTRRLHEIIDQQNVISAELNQNEVGRTAEVLVESTSRRSAMDWKGRTDSNKKVVFRTSVLTVESSESNGSDSLSSGVSAQQTSDGIELGFVIGDVVNVRIDRTTSASLYGHLIP